jgi:hypothetical protein
MFMLNRARTVGPGVVLSAYRSCVLLLLLFAALTGAAAVADKCEICSDNFTNQVFVVEDPIRLVKRHICLKCSKSKTVCSICGLATVPKTQRTLEDGRILCELDARGAILNEGEAQEIFREVKRDVQDFFKRFGKFPDDNVTAYLVNKTDFTKEYYRKPLIDSPEKLLGLTRSVSEDGTNFQHHIYLLSGLLRPQFAAVCAHEYTHTWLNERSTPTRTLNKDAVEGFCELIAWKYAMTKGYLLETNRIVENAYTRGQIHAMIAAEQRYDFRRIVDWIELGVDSWIDKDNLERVINLKDNPSDQTSAIPPWQQTTVPTVVPPTLVLRGVSGTSNRRFALVNDRTLEIGESAKVRVGDSNVVVRCVGIDDVAVTLEIGATKERRILKLAPKTSK